MLAAGVRRPRTIARPARPVHGDAPAAFAALTAPHPPGKLALVNRA